MHYCALLLFLIALVSVPGSALRCGTPRTFRNFVVPERSSIVGLAKTRGVRFVSSSLSCAKILDLIMGNSNSNVSTENGAKWSAKQVVEMFGEGQYLSGKTAIVTGGNSGIGLETVKALASAGARVILCSRSVSAGEKAVKTELLNRGEGNYVVDERDASSNVVVKALDLSSFSSIKAFAQDVLATEDRIDYLVLNAGIMALPKLEFTEAGFEKQIGVNHFGHFYLTQLLLEKVIATSTSLPQGQTMSEVGGSGCRIVTLSSVAHDMGSIDFNDINFKKGRKYGKAGYEAYGQSKLANLLFAKGLARVLEQRGVDGVAAVSVHPGVIKTALWRQSFMSKALGSVIADKSIPQGAATTIWACLAPCVQLPQYRGAYLSDCAMKVPSAAARRSEDALKLWEVSEQLVNEAATAAGLS